MHKNLLYYGDNLDILRRYIADETVDFIVTQLDHHPRRCSFSSYTAFIGDAGDEDLNEWCDREETNAWNGM